MIHENVFFGIFVSNNKHLEDEVPRFSSFESQVYSLGPGVRSSVLEFGAEDSGIWPQGLGVLF